MSIPFIDFREQNRLIAAEVDTGFKKVFEKGDYILGEQARLFEEAFARYCEAKHGVGVNSGTDALHLALLALGIDENDEVILPTHTFIATALCVSFCRAKPVFVDVEPDTYNIDPEAFRKAITKKTKAVIPVHIYGQPANMDEITSIAREHGIKVVEDAAQAHGSRYKNRRVGSLGDVACFSFYPTKSLGACGDAGMIVTSDKGIYERALMLRDYGRQGRYEHKIKGTNSRLDTIQAVILNAKLKHLDQWNQMRAKNAAAYAELLKPLKDVVAPVTKPDRTHVFQTYAVLVPNRDKVMEAMKAQGIGVLIHYPIGLHLQEAYAELGYKKGDFPVAEKVADQVMSLPMFPHMTREQVETVVAALKKSL
ncbi:MAG: DegT/DnrJ/EryC1/StrS family aminotransferase [Candidatus Omnitrophica bacterium]|nr:DegT/DnrJ/EryC1/StrS family aminotransferase [Candidatus Omnitrophota bacterium]MDE2222205.1 DegT/DnrJ/EryC1/StrS family aminotransferase [Candidatus Omnitrophota bacterium]